MSNKRFGKFWNFDPWWPQFWPDPKNDRNDFKMIFCELSNAAFRFSLRRPGTEIMGGGAFKRPAPSRLWKIQRPSRARVNWVALHKCVSFLCNTRIRCFSFALKVCLVFLECVDTRVLSYGRMLTIWTCVFEHVLRGFNGHVRPGQKMQDVGYTTCASKHAHQLLISSVFVLICFQWLGHRPGQRLGHRPGHRLGHGWVTAWVTGRVTGWDTDWVTAWGNGGVTVRPGHWLGHRSGHRLGHRRGHRPGHRLGHWLGHRLGHWPGYWLGHRLGHRAG